LRERKDYRYDEQPSTGRYVHAHRQFTRDQRRDHLQNIGVSNELGAFESGVAASLPGPVGAVVLRGIGTIVVVLTVARIWPQIRELKTLDVPSHEPA